jgi:hypothetical protein
MFAASAVKEGTFAIPESVFDLNNHSPLDLANQRAAVPRTAVPSREYSVRHRQYTIAQLHNIGTRTIVSAEPLAPVHVCCPLSASFRFLREMGKSRESIARRRAVKMTETQ